MDFTGGGNPSFYLEKIMDKKAMVISGVRALGALALAKAAGVFTKLKRKVFETFESSEAVGRMADVAFEFAFSGSLVASLLGITSDVLQAATWLVVFSTVAWFIAMMFLQHVLLKRKAWLDELAAIAKANEQRKKTAGLIRSIVRSELSRVSAPGKEKWLD